MFRTDPFRPLSHRSPAHPVVIPVAHGIAFPRAILCRNRPKGCISVFCCPHRVHHVRGAVIGIVGQDEVRARGVVDGRQIADGIVGVFGDAFGRAPAVGEAVMGVVPETAYAE
jgi:hypothetical protein